MLKRKKRKSDVVDWITRVRIGGREEKSGVVGQITRVKIGAEGEEEKGCGRSDY